MAMTSEQSSNSGFTKYFLAEYQYIAEAHFKTIEAISSFFRYYLIIMSLPFTLYAVIMGLSPEIGAIIYVLTALTGSISLIIALVGLFVTLYIVNLRFDAILYARTVNGIRKHFYDQADIDLNLKTRMRTLPQTPTLLVILKRTFSQLFYRLQFSNLCIFSSGLQSSRFRFRTFRRLPQ